METQFFTVKDIVRITGVTTRTVQYYDKINLLKPTRLSKKGYRIYSIKDLENLQTILFFKEMNLSLKEISDIMKLSKEGQQKRLKIQYETLVLKQRRLDTIITALDDYLLGEDIFNLNIFNNSPILPLQEQYNREAKIIYGETKEYKEYERKFEKLSDDEKANLSYEFKNNMEKVFKKIAKQIHNSPSSDEVQKLIVEWKSCLGQYITCDTGILKCIANTYKSDNRFKDYINQFSNEDLSEFIYQAVMFHCQN